MVKKAVGLTGCATCFNRKTTMLDVKTLAKIHIAKKELALDDDSYRAVLKGMTGKTSAKDLTETEALNLLAYFKRIGWKPKTAKVGKRPNPPLDKAALIGKIEAQLAEAQRPWAYADGMAKRMFAVEKLDWCDTFQLAKIVAALSYDAKRNGRVER